MGDNVRHAYSKIDQLTNGVIFHFEEGDDEIANGFFEIITASKQLPTSLTWYGTSMTPKEVTDRLQEAGALDCGNLGVRITVDESQLLRECLDFFRSNYPTLLSMVNDIESQLFSTRH